MNAQERIDQRNKLVEEINSLKRAIEANDPTSARSVSKDPALKWLCEECPYLKECRKMENASTAA